MNGEIGKLIGGPYPRDRELCKKIFGSHFQTVKEIRDFLQANLIGGSVSSHLMSHPSDWTVKSFQALYIACWIHHPVEKGSYMIPLSSWTYEFDGFEGQKRSAMGRLSSRISSHLSGRGWSASQDWHFLNGYHELLIQIEDLSGTQRKPHMMLKAEGHTTGISGGLGHMSSFITKWRTGEGNMSNAVLHAYSNLSPMVEGRAAENYAKGYESILTWLGLRGSLITVREVMYKLFNEVKWPQFRRHEYGYFDRATNKELGLQLKMYINDCRTPNGEKYRGPKNYKSHFSWKQEYAISDKKLNELNELAESMIADGNILTARSYREVIVSAEIIDKSVMNFCNYNDYAMPSLFDSAVFKPKEFDFK